MIHEKKIGILHDVENLPQHLVKILWSGFYLALAFVLMSYLENLLTALCSAFLDYKTAFNLYEIDRINGGRGYWSMKRVLLVYLTGPIFGLITSLISGAVTYYTDFDKTHLRLFAFWISVCALGIFLSYFLSGLLFFNDYNSPFYSGYVVVMRWNEVDSEVMKLMLLIMSIIASLLSLLMRQLVLSFSYSGELMESRNGRQVMFVHVVILPAIFAFLIILPLFYPFRLNFLFIRLVCLGIIFFWFFVSTVLNVGPSPHIRKNGIVSRSPVLLILLICCLIIAALTVFRYKVGV